MFQPSNIDHSHSLKRKEAAYVLLEGEDGEDIHSPLVDTEQVRFSVLNTSSSFCKTSSENFKLCVTNKRQ